MENIPAGKVPKVTNALLERIGEAIDKGDKLKFPGLVLIPRTLLPRDAYGDKPARPERKVFTLHRRQPKANKAV